MATFTHEPVIAALIEAGADSCHTPATDEDRLLAAVVSRSEHACDGPDHRAKVMAGCFLACEHDQTARLIAAETKDGSDWRFMHQLARILNPDCGSVLNPGEIITSLSGHPRGRLAMAVCSTLHAGEQWMMAATVQLLAFAEDTQVLLRWAASGPRSLAAASVGRLTQLVDLVELLEFLAEHRPDQRILWRQVVDAMSDEEFYRALSRVPDRWPLTHMVLKIHREGPVGR